MEVGKLYYRDKEDHMRKEENCNKVGHEESRRAKRMGEGESVVC